MLGRLLLIATLLLLPMTAHCEESLGKTIKKIFATPTPTPKPKKKTTSTAKKKSSPSPTPKKKQTPAKSEDDETPAPKKKTSPSPSASPKKKKTVTEADEEETPKPKKKSSPSPSASPHHKKKSSPSPTGTPQPFETPERSTSPSPTPSETPSATPHERHGAPNATLRTDEIKGFDDDSPKVQELIRSALDLTTRDLTYKYGSDDPANGGMDCSGFVYFVLKQNGVADVPRDSSGQYNWLRRAKRFEPVLSEKNDSFELDELKPGDLLFWTGTYAIERDPPITHAMIYLGREKKSGKRVMVGSSDGRVYQGESRNGVSVFDFNVERSKHSSDTGKLRPTFIGYGHVPGLRD